MADGAESLFAAPGATSLQMGQVPVPHLVPVGDEEAGNMTREPEERVVQEGEKRCWVPIPRPASDPAEFIHCSSDTS